MIADVCLLLLLDASASVSASEWQLQAKGTADALASQQIVEKMTSGPHKRIAIAAVEWSGASLDIAPWTTIASADDAKAFAHKLANHKRIQFGSTNVTGALQRAAKTMDAAPDCIRKVVDISSDGADETGYPKPVIDAMAANDIVVNAIVVYTGGAPDDPEEDPTPWYERIVTGFVKHASWENYRQIIQSKLALEIASAN